jgi:hypothetical protein
MAVPFQDGFPQFLDGSGNPLSGGKLYTYAAGTLVRLGTYTTQAGDVANANPIILDSAGRANIWLDPTRSYRLVLTDSDDVAIRDVDNIRTNGDTTVFAPESQTATDGQTVFDLASIAYVPGRNSIMVFRGGLKLELTTDYTETSPTRITLTSPAAAGDLLSFVSGSPLNTLSPVSDAVLMSYTLDGADTTDRFVQDKLAESVSITDFDGADPTGATDSSAAWLAADAHAAKLVYVPTGTFIVDSCTVTGKTFWGPGTVKWASDADIDTPMLTVSGGGKLQGLTLDGNKAAHAANITARFDQVMVRFTEPEGQMEGCTVLNAPGNAIDTTARVAHRTKLTNCYFKHCDYYCAVFRADNCDAVGCTFFGVGVIDGHAIRYGRTTGDGAGDLIRGGVVGDCTFKYVNSVAVLVERDAIGVSISNNNISYCRGFVKVEYQADDDRGQHVVFSGNVVEYTKFGIDYDEETEIGTQDTDDRGEAGSFAGGNCVVTGNLFFEASGVSIGRQALVADNLFIYCQGSASNNAIIRFFRGSSVCQNNVILCRGDETVSYGILDDGSAASGRPSVIDGNVIMDASNLAEAIRVASPAGNNVTNNKIFGAPIGIVATGSAVGVVITGNSFSGVSTPLQGGGLNGLTNVIRNNVGVADYQFQATVDSTAVTVGPGWTRVVLDIASSGDLATINGMQAGQMLVIRQQTASRDITLKHGTGNISMAAAADWNINTTTAAAIVVYDGTTVQELRHA